jgi:hypothetical protein
MGAPISGQERQTADGRRGAIGRRATTGNATNRLVTSVRDRRDPVAPMHGSEMNGHSRRDDSSAIRSRRNRRRRHGRTTPIESRRRARTRNRRRLRNRASP